MNERLSEWLRGEMDRRNLSIRELADKADLPHSSVGRAAQPNSNIGPKVLTKLAAALRVSPINLFEMAGLLPASPPESTDTRHLTHIYMVLKEPERKELIRYAEYLRDRQ